MLIMNLPVSPLFLRVMTSLMAKSHASRSAAEVTPLIWFLPTPKAAAAFLNLMMTRLAWEATP
jgi:hypothetical protein